MAGSEDTEKAVNTSDSASPTPTVLEPHSIFDERQKALIVTIVSLAATFSGFASNIYFPALQTIADAFDVSIELINLTVTSYLIFQALAPSLWGPISDVRGRRTAYTFTFLVFLGACIGLAVSENYATLVALRCLQSTGSASTIAIGAGVIGDITTRAERGGYMGVYQAGSLLPVAIGPVIGGALAGTLGWRSIFWFLAIYSAVFLLLLLLLLPETLRSLVANGQRLPADLLARYPLRLYQQTTKVDLRVAADASVPDQFKGEEQKRIDLTSPIRILLSKHAAPVIFFVAIYYAVWQMSITAMSTLFQDRYGLSEIQVGLTFIANGAGSGIGTLVTGRLLNVDYQRVQVKYLRTNRSKHDFGGHKDADITNVSTSSGEIDHQFPIEEARLRLVPVLSGLQCTAILVFGWTIQYPQRVHIAVPIITTFVTGWTLVSAQSAIMTYLVDVFPQRSAAASASLNLARCLLAAAGTSIVMPMINKVGVGPAFSICVGIQLVALVGLLVQWRYAAAWREEAQGKAER